MSRKPALPRDSQASRTLGSNSSSARFDGGTSSPLRSSARLSTPSRSRKTAFFISRDGFPLGLIVLDCGVRDQQMPDDCLAGLSVRRDHVGIDGWHNHAGVRNFSRVATIAADDSGKKVPINTQVAISELQAATRGEPVSAPGLNPGARAANPASQEIAIVRVPRAIAPIGVNIAWTKLLVAGGSQRFSAEIQFRNFRNLWQVDAGIQRRASGTDGRDFVHH